MTLHLRPPSYMRKNSPNISISVALIMQSFQLCIIYVFLYLSPRPQTCPTCPAARPFTLHLCVARRWTGLTRQQEKGSLPQVFLVWDLDKFTVLNTLLQCVKKHFGVNFLRLTCLEPVMDQFSLDQLWTEVDVPLMSSANQIHTYWFFLYKYLCFFFFQKCISGLADFPDL